MNVIKLKPVTEDSPRRETPHLVVFQRMIPNLITLMALCAGVTSIQNAIKMEWDKAIMSLMVAMVLDALDGATARILKATSEFGAHLDTLSDFMAFGIAPATLLYLWILEESGRVGWIAMLFYVCATAMRLARFNTQQKSSKALAGFFTGVPSPAGAGLLMMPVILWMQNEEWFAQFGHASPAIAVWTIVVASLMISRIPTFSIKNIRLPSKAVMPVMAFAVLMIAALVNLPWQTMTVLGLTYLASIPFAVLRARKLRKDMAEEAEEAEEVLPI